MALPGGEIEVHGNFRFAVIVDGIAQAAFSECRLPNLQVETIDIKEGGQNTYVHRLPVRVNAGSVTLRHGVTRSASLLSWYLQVLNGDMQNAVRQVTVVVYDVARTPLATWSFRNAYPIKWSGPALKADDQGLVAVHIGVYQSDYVFEILILLGLVLLGLDAGGLLCLLFLVLALLLVLPTLLSFLLLFLGVVALLGLVLL